MSLPSAACESRGRGGGGAEVTPPAALEAELSLTSPPLLGDTTGIAQDTAPGDTYGPRSSL